MTKTSDFIPIKLRGSIDDYELKRDGEGKPIGWVVKACVAEARRRQRRIAVAKFTVSAFGWGLLALAIALIVEAVWEVV